MGTELTVTEVLEWMADRLNGLENEVIRLQMEND